MSICNICGDKLTTKCSCEERITFTKEQKEYLQTNLKYLHKNSLENWIKELSEKKGSEE